MRPFYANPGHRIGTLRLRGGGEAERLRLRLGRLLDGADPRPAGLPPAATLIVKRLSDPSPTRLRLSIPATRIDSGWEQAWRDDLARVYTRAARPATGTVPIDADAVRFSDRAEMLACLLTDLCSGVARRRWWWRLLLAEPAVAALNNGGDMVAGLLARDPIWLPAIFHHLTKLGRTALITQALSPAQALGLARLLCRAYGLPDPFPSHRSTDESHRALPVAPTGVVSHGRFESEEPPRVEKSSAEGRSPDRENTADRARSLLRWLAAELFRQPATARSPEFARLLRRRWTAPQQPAVVPPPPVPNQASPATPPLPGGRHPTPPEAPQAPSRSPSAVAPTAGQASARPPPAPSPPTPNQAPPPPQGRMRQAPWAEAPPTPPRSPRTAPTGAGAPHPPHRATAPSGGHDLAETPTLAETQADAAFGCDSPPLPSSGASPRKAKGMGAPEFAQGPPSGPPSPRPPAVHLSPTPRPTAGERPPRAALGQGDGLSLEAGVDTELGGVLYLLNVMLRLDMPAAFEADWRLASRLGAWGTLEALAWGLLGGKGGGLGDDPLWSALAALAGREATAPLGRGIQAGNGFRLPTDWPSRLRRPVGDGYLWRHEDGRLLLWSDQGYLLCDRPRGGSGVAAARDALRPYLTRAAADSPGPRATCGNVAFRLAAGQAAAVPYASLQGAWVRAVDPVVRIWLTALLPYLDLYLRQVLCDDGPTPGRSLLLHPARLYVSSTHVDLVLPLEGVYLPVRMAGLDRDPGWLPDLGRVVSIHFD